MRDYDRRESEIKKMVTSVYGRGTQKNKHDIGFTETIRWYSCAWTSPGWPGKEIDKTTYSVIMPDGHRTELKYGLAKDLIIDMLDNGDNGGFCEGFWIENESESQITSVDEIIKKIGWDNPVWYGVNDWQDYDIWMYEYVIYLGDNKPKYFAAHEIEELPDLSDVGEVYLEDDLVQEGPCPYDYHEESTE